MEGEWEAEADRKVPRQGLWQWGAYCEMARGPASGFLARILLEGGLWTMSFPVFSRPFSYA